MENKVYEVEMIFDKEVLTEEQLKSYLEETFDKDVFQRKDYKVTALFHVPYDSYTDYADELSNSIGDVLKGGEYGVCTGHFEVDID